MRALSRPADAVVPGQNRDAEPAKASRPRPARLPQIDVMRLLICASVVATHVVSNANPLESGPANAVVNVLHYTRQAFFFISALVLVHVHWADVRADGRVISSPGSLRRRVSVLGVPYLVWSTFYAVLGLITAYSWGAFKQLPWTWFVGLLQGTDGYHMYFLLVSVEFALVFPFFLKLLHATRRHHVALLVVSGSIELATMALFHYVYQPDGWWRAFVGESSLTAYQFWVILGGVAAVHLDAFHAWAMRHKLLIGFAMAGVCLAATGIFLAEVQAGELPEFAGRSLQPITVPLSLAAIGAFYLFSVWLARQRWAGRLIVSGTYLSFGIYLSHPAILTGLLYLQKHLPPAVARHAVSVTFTICVLDFVLAVGAAAVFSRTRWSKALIGRSRRARARQRDEVPAAASAAPAVSPAVSPVALQAESVD
ncbi:acyltransferase [Rugosimonospora africana]|uniref:Acyltransferase n=1 Tax=Rugosimonospora africana TaxID=556532 RepID=A0A8J3QTI2_9ACTN|nr:acyltransferase [Rugosimonospora africana]GIH16533.1 acyltransferase [Rugosimonospora africana]